MTDQTPPFVKPELIPIQEQQQQIAEGAQSPAAAIDTLVSAAGLVGPRDRLDEVGAQIRAAGLDASVVGVRPIDQQVSAAVDGAVDRMRLAQEG